MPYYLKEKTEKRYKFWVVCSLFLMVLFFGGYAAAAKGSEEIEINEKQVQCDSEEIGAFHIPEDTNFLDDSQVLYFAYMDLNEADEALKSKILQARNIVISNSSWVADGVNGYIENRDTGIITPLPHFSEIFPSDWDMPVYPTEDAEQ